MVIRRSGSSWVGVYDANKPTAQDTGKKLENACGASLWPISRGAGTVDRTVARIIHSLNAFFDTNLLVYAANADAPECSICLRFFEQLHHRDDVVVCELVLVELYLK